VDPAPECQPKEKLKPGEVAPNAEAGAYAEPSTMARSPSGFLHMFGGGRAGSS